jgi:hypothetical protein
MGRTRNITYSTPQNFSNWHKQVEGRERRGERGLGKGEVEEKGDKGGRGDSEGESEEKIGRDETFVVGNSAKIKRAEIRKGGDEYREKRRRRRGEGRGEWRGEGKGRRERE